MAHLLRISNVHRTVQVYFPRIKLTCIDVHLVESLPDASYFSSASIGFFWYWHFRLLYLQSLTSSFQSSSSIASCTRGQSFVYALRPLLFHPSCYFFFADRSCVSVFLGSLMQSPRVRRYFGGGSNELFTGNLFIFPFFVLQEGAFARLYGQFKTFGATRT